mmetsp:Transcript_1463/g.5980  ORF Transcript_1463/g.5980 Transcript_1463/m.5980 type:complete len:204 (+) Transcript_1463:910-1521(+)
MTTMLNESPHSRLLAQLADEEEPDRGAHRTRRHPLLEVIRPPHPAVRHGQPRYLLAHAVQTERVERVHDGEQHEKDPPVDVQVGLVLPVEPSEIRGEDLVAPLVDRLELFQGFLRARVFLPHLVADHLRVPLEHYGDVELILTLEHDPRAQPAANLDDALEHLAVVVALRHGGDGHDLGDGAEPKDVHVLQAGHVLQGIGRVR